MWALLPVKRFAAGKSRLAAVLSHRQRAELTCRMLEDVLNALQRARSVEKTIVLSNEEGIDAVLEDAGVERYPEAEEGDMNRSLMAAAARLPVSAGRVLILPADVPAVRAEDIDALSEAHAGGIVLCPAALDGGTNALLSCLPLAIPLQFGDESFVRHLDSARQRGVTVRVVSRTGLARDVDRPVDLEWLADCPHAGGTRSHVRRLLLQAAECEAG